MKRKPQIGVMGSAADLNYAKEVEQAAERIGELLAERGAIVLYGAEKDYDSLSTAAARGAKRAGGFTVGVTYGRGKDIWDQEGNTDVIVVSGLERGGGREFVLVNSCDGVIAIAGGSGTCTELAIAYQLNIPMVALAGFGGWADRLAGQFFDERKRRPVLKASSPEEAVELMLREIGAQANS
ncbi:LOG family protein [Candidatus Parcubacteria bacterium]|nr:LOG family protein [Candidatus Parcubacteria bacterium]